MQTTITGYEADCIVAPMSLGNVPSSKLEEILLDTFSQPAKALPKAKCQSKKCIQTQEQEKDSAMSTYFNTHDEQKSYLIDRAYSIQSNKDREASVFFGLRDDVRPSTANELVKRIRDGLFVIPSDKGDRTCHAPFEYIRWRDPAKKEDKEGYKTWRKGLDAAHTRVVDAIAVLAPEEALKKVHELEAYPVQ